MGERRCQREGSAVEQRREGALVGCAGVVRKIRFDGLNNQSVAKGVDIAHALDSALCAVLS